MVWSCLAYRIDPVLALISLHAYVCIISLQTAAREEMVAVQVGDVNFQYEQLCIAKVDFSFTALETQFKQVLQVHFRCHFLREFSAPYTKFISANITHQSVQRNFELVRLLDRIITVEISNSLNEEPRQICLCRKQLSGWVSALSSCSLHRFLVTQHHVSSGVQSNYLLARHDSIIKI